MILIDNREVLESYNNRNKGNFFLLPCRFFGKDCTQLYKIQGFIEKRGVWWVYGSRINKRTGLIPNNAPIIEGFKYCEIFKDECNE